MLDPRLEQPQAHEPGRRVQLRSIGELLAPGCCTLCRSGNCDEGYLDLDTFVDYEGCIYICVNCLESELLPAVGAFSADIVNEARNELTARKNKIEALTSELEQARERLNHYDSLFNSVISSGADVISAAVEITEGSVERNDEVNDHADSGESESEEPVKSERRVKPKRATGSDAPVSGFTV